MDPQCGTGANVSALRRVRQVMFSPPSMGEDQSLIRDIQYPASGHLSARSLVSSITGPPEASCNSPRSHSSHMMQRRKIGRPKHPLLAV